MVHRIGAGGPDQREKETPSGPQIWGWKGYSERGRHQVVLRIRGGGAIQREGDTKWSSELVLEGLFRERETPSGPQNWGWRGYSERGRHQVVHRIGGGGAIQREGGTKWSTELGWVVVASSCFWYLLLVMVAGWLVGYLLTFGDVGWLAGWC